MLQQVGSLHTILAQVRLESRLWTCARPTLTARSACWTPLLATCVAAELAPCLNRNIAKTLGLLPAWQQGLLNWPSVIHTAYPPVAHACTVCTVS